jgi:hypothetical protein
VKAKTRLLKFDDLVCSIHEVLCQLYNKEDRSHSLLRTILSTFLTEDSNLDQEYFSKDFLNDAVNLRENFTSALSISVFVKSY